MSFFSFFKTNKEELSIVFYMGSSSVAAALVKFSPHTVPMVLYTTHEQISLAEKPSSQRFLSIMLDALELVSKKIHKDGLSRIKELTKTSSSEIKTIHCVFSSPWYISQTKIAHEIKPEGFVINQKIIQTVMEAEQKGFIADMKGKIPTADNGDLSLIESKVMGIKLNGYAVENPHDKKTTQAEFSIFLSAASKSICTKIDSVIKKHFHFHEIQFHSFSLVVFSALRDMKNTGRNFLITDVGGEITDIAVVKDNIVLETVSFPVGKNSFIRDISEKMGVTPEIAISMLKMSAEGRLDKNQAINLEGAVMDFQKAWVSEFHNSLSAIAKSVAIPKKVFLATTKNLSNYFLKFIKQEQYSSFMPVQEQFQVIPLNECELRSICGYHPKAIQDPFLALESIFIDKVRKHTV